MTSKNVGITAVLAAAVLAVPASAWAQTYYPTYVAAYPAPPVAAPVQGLSDAQLDQLLAPVALYPDPLLSQLLPAATFPLEIVSAAQFLRDMPTPTEDVIAAQPWDDSIKALAHYPTVIADLANRIDATQAMGAAFVNQPDDVMRSIQRLRAEAQVNGALANSPEQTIAASNGIIQILPADPQIIYVPIYDPAIVYIQGGRRGSIGFGPRYRFGTWLNHDFDWKNHHVIVDRSNDHHDAGPPPQQWVRDQHKPAPSLPRTYEHPAPLPEHRGYVPPPAQRTEVYPTDQHRADVDREVQRAQHSRPGIIPVTPPPHPNPVNTAPPKPATPPHAEPSKPPGFFGTPGTSAPPGPGRDSRDGHR